MNYRILLQFLVWTNFQKKINWLFTGHDGYRDFFLQPFTVAESFTGIKGALVSIEDTIKGFNMIMDGKVDQYPESAFMLVGTIEDAIEKGEKILAQSK